MVNHRPELYFAFDVNLRSNRTMQVDTKQVPIQPDKDINDAFEDILLSEEKIISSSYQEGFDIGVSQGNPEAYHLGYHRGAELGAELGYYSGIINGILKEANTNEEYKKRLKLLEEIYELIEAFPKHNSEDVDIFELLTNIRAKFKKSCALLKFDAAFPETKGGLMKPSDDFLKKCTTLEHLFKTYNGDAIKIGKNYLKNLIEALGNVDLSEEVKNLFFRCLMYFKISILNRNLKEQSKIRKRKIIKVLK